MAWFKVDDRFSSSRKLLRIPRSRRTAAVGLWTLAGTWSARDLTDGWIPAYAIEEFGADLDDAEALVSAGLWDHEEQDGEHGFVFVNWGEYQPTKDQVEEEREAARERKRRQRRNAKGEFAGQDDVTQVSRRDTSGLTRDTTVSHGESQRGHTVPVPSRPDPSRPDPAPTTSATAEFDEWWTHWRRKKAIGDARKAFPAARKRATLEQLIAGADAYFAWIDRNGIADQYVIGPGAWLRQERWADELTDRQQQRPNREVGSRDSLVQAHFDMQQMGAPS